MQHPRFLLAATCTLAGVFASSLAHALDVVHPTCEHLVNPMGIDADAPRLSWQLTADTRGAKQTAYQIKVASSPEKLAKPDLWDSGKIASADQLLVAYEGQPLAANQACFWQVTVWDEHGQANTGPVAHWRMGLLEPSDWHGQWITRQTDVNVQPAPLLRHVFDVPSDIASAQLYVCGLGYADAHVNGQMVGDRILDPGYTAFDHRALYASHDVTDLLQSGKNAIGVELGNGWFNVQDKAVWYFEKAPWRMTPRVLLELRVTLKNGETQTITSQPDTWQTAESPTVYNSIYGGESFDAGKRLPGWDTPSFDAANWQPAIAAKAPTDLIVSQTMPPVRMKQRFAAQTITEPEPGVYVVDFGQNMAGITEVTFDLPEGTVVSILHGERLKDNGRVDIEESARHYRGGIDKFQRSTFIADGSGQVTWAPRFTYYGFQYCEITGLPSKPAADAITAVAVHSDVESQSHFASDNDLFNKIQEATKWSFRNNFVSIPTDCPQREKNGWTGDAHLAAEQALFNFKPSPVYAKWIDDITDAQREDGAPSGIVPTSGWGYGIGPSWDSALFLIPDYMHTYTADERVLTEHYQAFCHYLAFLKEGHPDGIVRYGLGDWVPWKTETPAELTGTAYFYKDTLIAAKTARLLGLEDEAKAHEQQATFIKDAFNKTFFDEANQTYANSSLTALSCALYQGLVPAEHHDAVVEQLVQAVHRADSHIDTGILGAKYVLLALMDNGHTQLACDIVNQKTKPGWGWWFEQGATTLWEDWNAEWSLNHVMFGDVSAWFYKALAGIRPDETAPGFGHVFLKPFVPADMHHVDASFDGPRGTIASRWDVVDGQFVWTVTIPANSTATAWLPVGCDVAQATENGKPIDASKGIETMQTDKGETAFQLGSGTYTFKAPFERP